MPASPNHRISSHYSPLRYPGGKSKVAAFVKRIITENNLSDGEYIEPYAGGAGIALSLLLEGYVHRIRINDISVPIFSFWSSILNETDRFCEEIEKLDLSVTSWRQHRAVFLTGASADTFDLGFSTFVLNRTNRSGILNGGPIGGHQQTGTYKIDARFNRKDLIARIKRIARLRRQIVVSCEDAANFLVDGKSKWGKKTLIYCDPPYFVKGRDLYYDFYKAEDHAKIASILGTIDQLPWIVSYDNVPEIIALYDQWPWISYQLGYSAREARQGQEIMFFGPDLKLVEIAGPLTEVERYSAA